MNLSDTFIVSGNFSKEERGVLIVGKQHKGVVTIINAFQGKEAWDLFKKLSTQRFNPKEKIDVQMPKV